MSDENPDQRKLKTHEPNAALEAACDPLARLQSAASSRKKGRREGFFLREREKWHELFSPEDTGTAQSFANVRKSLRCQPAANPAMQVR